jgi:YbbR domain-containing protein
MTSDRNSSSKWNRPVIWVLFALLIAILVYIFRPLEPPHKVDILVPVSFENLPAGLVISTPLPKGIEIRLQGPRKTIDAVNKNNPKYVIDLSGRKPGRHSIPIAATGLPLPKAITVLKITPTGIDLMLEKEIKKHVTVNVTLLGKPLENYHITSTAAKPDRILLSGPEYALTRLEAVSTKPIDITGLRDTFRKEITLDLPENIKPAEEPGTVVAEIDIQARILTKTFKKIRVIGKNTAHRYSITPTHITIEIKGPANILENMKAENSIPVSVDLKGLKPGVYVRRSIITLPVGTTLVSAKPELFTVKIKN